MKQQKDTPHDVGGQRAGQLRMASSETSFWELKIDAMISLMREKGAIKDWGQLRLGVEALSRQDYDTLGYYERWAVAAAEIAIAQNLVTREQLEQRVSEMESTSVDGGHDRA